MDPLDPEDIGPEAAPAAKVSPLSRRVAAAQAVLNAFKDRPLVWGVRDCGIMAATLLAGLDFDARMERFGTYRTELGARRAMKRQGFADLPAVLDDLGLEQIAVSRILPADLLAVPGHGALSALAIVLGNGAGLYFDSDGFCRVGRLMAMNGVRAWRVASLNPVEAT